MWIVPAFWGSSPCIAAQQLITFGETTPTNSGLTQGCCNCWYVVSYYDNINLLQFQSSTNNCQFTKITWIITFFFCHIFCMKVFDHFLWLSPKVMDGWTVQGFLPNTAHIQFLTLKPQRSLILKLSIRDKQIWSRPTWRLKVSRFPSQNYPKRDSISLKSSLMHIPA